MALYSGNAATEASSGASFEPGAFKFKVTEASLNNYNGVNYTLQTWTEDGKEGPKVFDRLNLSTTSDAMKQEIDRRLTTMLGKVSIDSPDELVGKTGWVMLGKGHRYLKAMPFGSYFDANKRSATGKTDGFEGAKAQAIKYDWTQDQYEVKKAQESQGHLASVDTGSDEPF